MITQQFQMLEWLLRKFRDEESVDREEFDKRESLRFDAEFECQIRDIPLLPEAAGSETSVSGCAKFPRNPERDENGRAVLYPGRIRYEGYAALFTSPFGGEVVVMAPDINSLDVVVQAHRIRNDGDPVDEKRCVHAKLVKVRNEVES